MRPPPVLVQLLFYASVIAAVGVLPPYSRLEVPFAHVALSGDLHITLHSPPSPLPDLQLAIYRLESGITHFLVDFRLHPSLLLQEQKLEWNQHNGQNWILDRDSKQTEQFKDSDQSKKVSIENIEDQKQSSNWNQNQSQNEYPKQENVRFTIPCGYFVKGGTYLLRIHGADQNLTDVETSQDSKLSGVLDVRWPSPKVTITPENIQTFPEHSVTGIVEFPEVMCPPADLIGGYVPEFYLELWFCGDGGPTLCSKSPLGAPLYSEAVKGLTGRKEVVLRCELFGVAGTYALTLRPTIPQPTLVSSTAYLKASWSEQFVLTVHARSVLPCDTHAGGVPVLLQYPACVLERADRVRVYARPAGAVRSSYIAEMRVERGSHSLRFPCDLFSERYPEYCFVYVSQAVNGAVSDVREECLPTLPMLDGATSGGWGPWSSWSPCSGRCGGTRARYRYCDSPPPPYGAPHCQGPAVESEACSVDGQPCPWAPGSQGPPGDPCRCGCVLRLGSSPRHLAASAQECQGRTFWLLEVNPGHIIRLTLERYRLPCGAQWLKARDGGSPGAPLLGQWPGDGDTQGEGEGDIVLSSGQQILLEFFSDELLAAGSACPGGFLANAAQIEPVASNASASIAVSMSESHITGHSSVGSVLVVASLAGVGLLLVAPALCWLVLRTLHATSKYQRANDCDSLADSDIGPGSAAALGLGGSRGTLLSEVLSLRRLRPGAPSHRLLRESRDMTEECGAQERGNLDHDGQNPHAGGWSSGSSITLAAVESSPGNNNMNRTGSGQSLPAPNTSSGGTGGGDTNSSPLRRSRTCSPVRKNQDKTLSLTSDADSTSMSVDMSTSERESSASYDFRRNTETPQYLIKRSAISENGSRSESVNTLTNGCYSPALSATSCARVRATGGKERKERRNLRLRAPPSELSLGAPDFEIDYYDYNVTNAGAVPGSYLGMDPAFLVWIPPLDENDEKHNHTYEEILPRQNNVDPGSNTESPEDYADQPELTKMHFKPDENMQQASPKIDRRLLLTKTNIVHPLNFSISDLAPAKSETSVEAVRIINPRREPLKQVSIAMKDFTIDNKLRETFSRGQSEEKETSCEKSPTDHNYSDISDIQFADDDSDSSNSLKNHTNVENEKISSGNLLKT